MRRNFIFDIGNVLIDFLPARYLEGLFEDPRARRAMMAAVFQSREWIELDRGALRRAEATEILAGRHPEWAAAIRLTMARLTDMLTPVEPTIALLPGIAAGGHGLYYLSNYHAELAPYILGRYAWFGLFDGGVFSCDVHSVKPEPEIYRRLLDRYALDPADCTFFDDVQENVDAARRAGIDGVLFRSAADVARQL